MLLIFDLINAQQLGLKNPETKEKINLISNIGHMIDIAMGSNYI